MVTIDVDVLTGDVEAVAFPAMATSSLIVNGYTRLHGFSVREASGDVSQEKEGSVTSPGAGSTIVTVTGIPAGTYTVKWTVSLAGTLAAADANNFELTDSAGNVTASINLAVAGDYPQGDVIVTLPANGTVSVTALGVATVGAIYSAQLSLIASITDDVVAEIMDGNQTLACIGLGVGGSDTEWFGATGLKVMASISVNIISGTLKGVIYVSCDD